MDAVQVTALPIRIETKEFVPNPHDRQLRHIYSISSTMSCPWLRDVYSQYEEANRHSRSWHCGILERGRLNVAGPIRQLHRQLLPNVFLSSLAALRRLPPPTSVHRLFSRSLREAQSQLTASLKLGDPLDESSLCQHRLQKPLLRSFLSSVHKLKYCLQAAVCLSMHPSGRSNTSVT